MLLLMLLAKTVHSSSRDERRRCARENSESGLFFVINPHQTCTCYVDVHFTCLGSSLPGATGWIWTDISMSLCVGGYKIYCGSCSRWAVSFVTNTAWSHRTAVARLLRRPAQPGFGLIDALLTDAGLMELLVYASEVNLRQSTKSLLINASAQKPNNLWMNEWLSEYINK